MFPGGIDDFAKAPSMFPGGIDDAVKVPSMFPGGIDDSAKAPTLFPGGIDNAAKPPSMFPGGIDDLASFWSQWRTGGAKYWILSLGRQKKPRHNLFKASGLRVFLRILEKIANFFARFCVYFT